MDLKALFSDPRRRNLAVLAGLALVGVLWAAIALNHRAAEVAPKYPPHEFFPGLAAKVDDVTRIHVVSAKSGAFDVVFVPMKGWVLPGRGNYPASFEDVRKTLVGMAALETIEPKTARRDWFHFVGLDTPPKGDGVQITLSDDHGRVLASMIAGKTEDIGDSSGALGLFVRKPEAQQSWLVLSPFEPHANEADWMDKTVVSVDRTRIQDVDVRPRSGLAYTLHRDKQSDADFALSPIPKGRESGDPGQRDAVAAALAGFSFGDIRRASDFDFDGQGSRVVTRTFDGLIVSVDVVHQGSDIWARVFADAVPGKPDAAKEANEINAHAAGWAYQLATYQGTLFSTPLEGLLKPHEAAKTKAGK